MNTLEIMIFLLGKKLEEASNVVRPLFVRQPMLFIEELVLGFYGAFHPPQGGEVPILSYGVVRVNLGVGDNSHKTKIME